MGATFQSNSVSSWGPGDASYNQEISTPLILSQAGKWDLILYVFYQVKQLKWNRPPRCFWHRSTYLCTSLMLAGHCLTKHILLKQLNDTYVKPCHVCVVVDLWPECCCSMQQERGTQQQCLNYWWWVQLPSTTQRMRLLSLHYVVMGIIVFIFLSLQMKCRD